MFDFLYELFMKIWTPKMKYDPASILWIHSLIGRLLLC